jgi:hypothetical protein
LCNGFAFALNQRHARLFRASANGGNLSVASEHLGLCLPASADITAPELEWKAYGYDGFGRLDIETGSAGPTATKTPACFWAFMAILNIAALPQLKCGEAKNIRNWKFRIMPAIHSRGFKDRQQTSVGCYFYRFRICLRHVDDDR